MLKQMMIRLDESVINDLDVIAHKEHLTKTEVIREAVEFFISIRKDSLSNKSSKLLSFAGILKDSDFPKDGLQYQREIREEWDR